MERRQIDDLWAQTERLREGIERLREERKAAELEKLEKDTTAAVEAWRKAEAAEAADDDQ